MHLAFDLLAYSVAAAATWWARRQLVTLPAVVPQHLRSGYLIAVTHGVVLGGVAFGTLNLMLSGHTPILGKSVLGALVGGIIAIEAFKALRGISGSTGAVLVPGIALGIAVGRVGCHLAGLDDHTYGIASTLPWAVDHGDGVPRHPVALYESLALVPMAIIAAIATARRNAAWLRGGFYVFALYYATQRFAWEFLKPYATLAFGLNLFQWLCLGLAAYALAKLRTRAQPRLAVA